MAMLYVCLKKIFFPLPVENKARDGESEYAFILGLMNCTVANNSIHAPVFFRSFTSFLYRYLTKLLVKRDGRDLALLRNDDNIFISFARLSSTDLLPLMNS
jgi:hypothetical protein